MKDQEDRIKEIHEICIRLDEKLANHLNHTCPRHEDNFKILFTKIDWLTAKVLFGTGIVCAVAFAVEHILKK